MDIKENLFVRIIFLLWYLTFILFATNIRSFTVEENLFVMFLFLIIYEAFVWRVRKNIGNDFPEYHGLEHKIVLLLRSKKEVNYQNLKTSKRVALDCGSTLIGLMALCLPFFLLTLSPSVERFINSLVSQNRPSFQMLKLGFCFLGLGLIITISLLNQAFVLTKEPSEDKLLEGLEIAKKAENVFSKDK